MLRAVNRFGLSSRRSGWIVVCRSIDGRDRWERGRLMLVHTGHVPRGWRAATVNHLIVTEIAGVSDLGLYGLFELL